MQIIIYITLFGAIGCLLRYYISRWTHNVFGAAFPYGTFIVNITGAFLIGLIMEYSLETEIISPELRIGLTIGLMGGLTTFSTFSYETFRLIEGGDILPAFINIAASVLICLFFTWGGIVTARYFL